MSIRILFNLVRHTILTLFIILIRIQGLDSWILNRLTFDGSISYKCRILQPFDDLNIRISNFFFFNLKIKAFSHLCMLNQIKSNVYKEDGKDLWSPSLNPLIHNLKMSQTVEMLSMVKDMQSHGKNIISLCVGEPDFSPPKSVLNAAIFALNNGETRYTDLRGTILLRRAISSDLYQRKGLHYDHSQIIVGNGAKQCVYQSILATLGVGDSAIIPSPFWPSYPQMVTLTGAKSIILPTDEKDGYLLSPKLLRRCLENNSHRRVKLLVLCNPSNPTGGVHNESRLHGLAQVLNDYPEVSVLSDEIYERLVYTPNNPHKSFATISSSMYERTITVNGFSKSYAMTGLRLGYMAAPTHFVKAVKSIQSQLTSCASSVSQAAGVAALTLVDEKEMEKNVALMKKKRDFIIGRLRRMPQIVLSAVPTGAFYVLPNVSSYSKDDDVIFCQRLLETKQVAIVPGSAFGAPGTVRISYATSLEELEMAMDKFEDFLLEYVH